VAQVEHHRDGAVLQFVRGLPRGVGTVAAHRHDLTHIPRTGRRQGGGSAGERREAGKPLGTGRRGVDGGVERLQRDAVVVGGRLEHAREQAAHLVVADIAAPPHEHLAHGVHPPVAAGVREAGGEVHVVGGITWHSD